MPLNERNSGAHDDPKAPSVQNRTRTPLRAAAQPFHAWQERRRLARELRETERQLAARADAALAEFHDRIWQEAWPQLLARAHQYTREEQEKGHHDQSS